MYPTMTRKERKKRQRRRSPVLLIATVLAGIMYYNTSQVYLAPALTQPAAETAAAANDEALARYQPDLPNRDPFAVPGEFQPRPAGNPAGTGFTANGYEPGGDRRPVNPVLTGVVKAGSGRSAILRLGMDSRSYKIGDSAGPYRVISIGDTSVTLSGPSGEIVLGLGR